MLQRKLLQPNHFTRTTDLEQALLASIAHSNQTANVQWSYTVEHLERKLGNELAIACT